MVENLAALERHLPEGCPHLRLGVGRVENARCSLRPVDHRTDGEADFVDESRAQKRAVVAAAALDQEPLHTELAVEEFERICEIQLPCSSEEVGHAVPAQAGEVRVRDLLAQHDDDGIAADFGPTPGDLPLRIQHHSVSTGVATGDPGFPRVSLAGMSIVGLPFRELLSRHPPDEPRVTAEFGVQTLEEIAPCASRRTPSAVQDSAIDARHHVAEYVGLHGPLSYSPR